MSFAIEHEKFQGPLHFLLEEIEKEKLSISEFALAKITEAFLKYIRTLPINTQEEIAEFLVVASRLLLIKSRSLLPQIELSQEEGLSIQELEDRLKLLQKIRERADELARLSKIPRYLYERESMKGIPIVFYPPAILIPADLEDAFREVLAAIPKPQKLQEEEIEKVISLEEKISELQESLRTRAEKLFSNIVKYSKDKTEIIVTFLAILELAKQKIVRLDQRSAFGDILIQRASASEAKEEPYGKSETKN